METLEELMLQLEGADAATVNRLAMEKGSLPVRLAMLGRAAMRKGQSPLWWSYPPGVFIGYKWGGAEIRELTQGLTTHIRALGYRVFLDSENLDEQADAYFQIPSFITSLQDCSFYLLLLTEAAADSITARKRKTTWIFDEYQHAVRLVNSGRLFLVPVLVEPNGATDVLTAETSIDMTAVPRQFERVKGILTPKPLALEPAQVAELQSTVENFDKLFLGQQWDASEQLLVRTPHLAATFDHQFRRMLHAIYTANPAACEAVQAKLHSVYGQQIVDRIYKGYCVQHGIPNRAT